MSSEVSRAHVNDPPTALARGTRLGEFELLRVLGIGGFGIVYLAFDHALEREVAVKEYMPASLVGRTETMHVTLRSQSDAETFALGLKSFVNEARLLARFDHPSLLKVLRFWEGNGTAYMAMPVLRGQTLKQLRLGHQQAPEEAWIRALLEPLLGAIDRLHSEGVYHRDIAPDNIQIEEDGHPVLLDFGAARRVISDKSQNLTAILKPAYAPIEQYAEVGSVKQGPWTDLYALGATIYFLLVGRPPSPATARSVHDDVMPLSSQQFNSCSEGFLSIIDWMLAPRPNDRPQNVSAVLDALHGRLTPPRRRPAEPPPPPPPSSQWDQTIMVPAPGKAAASFGQSQPPAPKDSAYEHEMETVVVPRHRPQPLLTPQTSARRAPPSPPRTPGRSSLLPLIGGLGALAVAAVVAAVLLWPRAPVEPKLEASAPPATVDSPAPSTGSTASVTVPAAPAAPVEPAGGSATTTAPVATEPAAPPVAAGSQTAPVQAGPVAASKPDKPLVDKPAAAPQAAPQAAASRTQKIPPPSRSTALQASPNTTRQQDAAPGATAPSTTQPDPYRQPAQPAGGSTYGGAAPAAANNPPAAAVATGPEGTCSAKSSLMYFVCMERECLRGALATHPDCQKWRASRPQQQ